MTTATLSLSGDLDIYRKPDLQAALTPLEDCDLAVLDLSNVRYLDAAALGCFLTLRSRMRAHGRMGRVLIRSAPTHIIRVIEICGLDAVFEIEQSHCRTRSAKSECVSDDTRSADRGLAS